MPLAADSQGYYSIQILYLPLVVPLAAESWGSVHRKLYAMGSSMSLTLARSVALTSYNRTTVLT